MTAPVGVTQRTDRAWAKGYEAGRADLGRWQVVAAVATTWATIQHRRHKGAPVVAMLWTVAGLVALAPFLILAVVVVGGVHAVRHHHRRTVTRRGRYVPTDTMYELDADSDF